MYTVCERFLPALAMRQDEEIILLCPTVLFLSSPHTAAKNVTYSNPRALLQKMVLTSTRTAAKMVLTSKHIASKIVLTSTRTAAKNGTYIRAHCCKKMYLHPRTLLQKIVLPSTRTVAKNGTYIHAHCGKKWYLHPRLLQKWYLQQPTRTAAKMLVISHRNVLKERKAFVSKFWYSSYKF
jgi:hypothetical protein